MNAWERLHLAMERADYHCGRCLDFEAFERVQEWAMESRETAARLLDCDPRGGMMDPDLPRPEQVAHHPADEAGE